MVTLVSDSILEKLTLFRTKAAKQPMTIQAVRKTKNIRSTVCFDWFERDWPHHSWLEWIEGHFIEPDNSLWIREEEPQANIGIWKELLSSQLFETFSNFSRPTTPLEICRSWLSSRTPNIWSELQKLFYCSHCHQVMKRFQRRCLGCLGCQIKRQLVACFIVEGIYIEDFVVSHADNHGHVVPWPRGHHVLCHLREFNAYSRGGTLLTGVIFYSIHKVIHALDKYSFE